MAAGSGFGGRPGVSLWMAGSMVGTLSTWPAVVVAGAGVLHSLSIKTFTVKGEFLVTSATGRSWAASQCPTSRQPVHSEKVWKDNFEEESER